MAMEGGLLWKGAAMLVQVWGWRSVRSKMTQVRYTRYWLEKGKSGKIAGGWIMRCFLVRDSLNSHKNCEWLKNNRNLFSYASAGRKSKIKVVAETSSLQRLYGRTQSCLLWLLVAVGFLPCGCVIFSHGVSSSVSVSSLCVSYKDICHRIEEPPA